MSSFLADGSVPDGAKPLLRWLLALMRRQHLPGLCAWTEICMRDADTREASLPAKAGSHQTDISEKVAAPIKEHT